MVWSMGILSRVESQREKDMHNYMETTILLFRAVQSSGLWVEAWGCNVKGDESGLRVWCVGFGGSRSRVKIMKKKMETLGPLKGYIGL